jgi:hypothetical protein
MLKYKAYAIKASTFLGYSLFLQNPHQGFSFQRHIAHKTEIFHIIKPLPGAFVFLCEYDTWQKIYDPTAFNAWLEGASVAEYEAHRFYPDPGDVFVLDRVGVVHSVIGCVLEEFATVSTDMVDRLHDQNLGRPPSEHFSRAFFDSEVAALPSPHEHRLVTHIGDRWDVKPLEPRTVPYGSETLFAAGTLTANRRQVLPDHTTPVFRDGERWTILHATSGEGQVVLVGEGNEKYTMTLSRGGLTLIPAGVGYVLANVSGGDAFETSEQHLPLATALVD